MGLLRQLIAVLAGVVALGAQPSPTEGNVAPYYPTPFKVVVEMLQLGELQPGELHCDLGSGDGRIVIVAARDFAAKSVGYEIDPELVKSSRRQIAELELTENAEIRAQDLYTADLAGVDLVTVYLLPRALQRLRPILEKNLKAGARIVSHDFPIKDWEPEQTVTLDNYDDPVDNWLHTIYLYRRQPATADAATAER